MEVQEASNQKDGVDNQNQGNIAWNHDVNSQENNNAK